ncbi:hypothetical protein BDZ90DRAFT_180243 [Jaminaea rosea]|uniref:Ubiquitin-like domain-containing protein n=1 Tax=Jaminaea rosea TaxID=1569628 RepID=A0A316UQA7_9BASI|nr:hypothetical protein BDZ90DRAFT_180243 [Jaminaea rosea]PWN27476.1 hypothetical protein BDZ90DRAFT_180243 [Jaminaea rosea]
MITITDADNDNIYPLDCDASITLADVKALLEADSSIPAARQALYFNATLMTEAEKTLEAYGVKDGDLLALRDSGRQQQQQPVASGSRQPTARGAGDRMMPRLAANPRWPSSFASKSSPTLTS